MVDGSIEGILVEVTVGLAVGRMEGSCVEDTVGVADLDGVIEEGNVVGKRGVRVGRSEGIRVKDTVGKGEGSFDAVEDTEGCRVTTDGFVVGGMIVIVGNWLGPFDGDDFSCVEGDLLGKNIGTSERALLGTIVFTTIGANEGGFEEVFVGAFVG